MAVTINNGTAQPIYVKDNSGTSVQVIKLDVGSGTALQDFGGTITRVNTIGTLEVGTVVVGSVANIGVIHNAGTLANGSLANLGVIHNAGTLTTGSLANLGAIHTAGTLTTGSLSSLAMMYAGTIDNVVKGTITKVEGGTLAEITNLTSGSVRMTVGTLTTGTLQNLVSGTVNALAAGTITGGTLGNLNYGTVAIDSKPAGSAVLTTHTLGTGGGTLFGTLVAPVGAGTYIYLTGVSIVGRSGGSIDVGIATNVVGSTGAGVIARGFFPTAGGGIREEFDPALRIGTNGTLAYFLITAGTADFTASYWVGP